MRMNQKALTTVFWSFAPAACGGGAMSVMLGVTPPGYDPIRECLAPFFLLVTMCLVISGMILLPALRDNVYCTPRYRLLVLKLEYQTGMEIDGNAPLLRFATLILLAATVSLMAAAINIFTSGNEDARITATHVALSTGAIGLILRTVSEIRANAQAAWPS